MNRMTIAGTAFAGLMMLATPSLAQIQCQGDDRPTEASCGGDVCSCAAPCSQNSDCEFGCCSGGFCALTCVCDGQGTVNNNCAGGGGCGCGGGTIAPTASPLGGGMAMLWGFSLIGVGLMASARFLRRGGLRSPAAVAALSMVLLGATFVTATAFEKSPVAGSKALAKR